ncbi:MAG TPA: hypothetical protein VGB75_05745 [Jatrophihabitans sp.]
MVALRALQEVMDSAPPRMGELFHILEKESAYSSRLTSMENIVSLLMNPPGTVARDVTDVVRIAREIVELRYGMRAIAKGQHVLFSDYGIEIAEGDSDPRIGDAIELYDLRQSQSRLHIGAVLGAVGSIRAVRDDPETDLAVTYSTIRSEPLIDPTEGRLAADDYHQWHPSVISLQRLAPGYYSRTQEANIAIDAVRALLEVSLDITQREHLGQISKLWSRYGWTSAPRSRLYGYLTKRLLEAGHSRLSTNSAIAGLTTYSEPIIRPARKSVIIDLSTATGALQDRHIRAVDGAEANAWGAAFEKHLQSQIDKTAHRPPPELRPLIGKKIRRVDRRVLTDIDAIAVLDGTLLLIDGKSYPSTEGIRQGEFTAIRAYREKVENDTEKWKRNCEYIDANRSILPVTIPASIAIAGIVVLPDVPYVLSGAATDRVLGLYRACSTTELMLRLTT